MLLLVLILFIAHVGCSLPPPPLEEESRTQLGTIGVVSARFVPEPELKVTSGRLAGGVAGTAKGALAGTLGGFLAGAVGCAPGGAASGLCAALGVAIGLPWGAVKGGMEGAAEAVPPESAEKMEAEIRKTFAEVTLQETLRDRFLQFSAKDTSYRFVIIDDSGPASPGEIISYRELQESGIDQVIEIGITDVYFTGKGWERPSGSLFMTATVKLLSVGDN